MKALWMACVMFALSSTANAFPKGQWLMTETSHWLGVDEGYVLPYSLLLDVDDSTIDFKLAGTSFYGTLSHEPVYDCFGDYLCEPFQTLFTLSVNARKQPIKVTALNIHEHRIFDRAIDDRAHIIHPWRALLDGANWALQEDSIVLQKSPYRVVFTRADRATAEAAIGIALATDLAYRDFHQCLEHHLALAAMGKRSGQTLEWMRAGFSAYRLLKARETAQPDADKLARINQAIARTSKTLLSLVAELPEEDASVIQSWGDEAPSIICQVLSR